MDFYKELEKIDKHVPVRDMQDITRRAAKSENRKMPYRNTANKCVGEHFPDINDKIKVNLNFLCLVTRVHEGPSYSS
jgi:hypothetical protein